MRAAPETPERRSSVIALDAVENAAVRGGIEYWRKLCGARPFPNRNDVSPREISGLLRNTVLLRVIEDGDYEFRIVGDAHVIAHGYSMQGKKLSQIDLYSPGYGALLKTLYDPVVQNRVPFALRGWLLKGDKNTQHIYTESVFLPLGPEDGVVDHVLNFSVYVPRDTRD